MCFKTGTLDTEQILGVEVSGSAAQVEEVKQSGLG
jgi:hypothetical protein